MSAINTRDPNIPESASAFWFTGATVITMNGDEEPTEAEVLVNNSIIVAVGRKLADQPELAEVIRSAQHIDASGCILAPGFVDGHRHAWEGQFRRSIADVDDLAGYVQSTLVEIAPQYQPDDMYIGTRLAAMTAIDSGITSMLDFSHNSRSAAHSDAAVQAQAEAGIRVVHASMSPHFGDWDHQWPDDLERLISTYASDLVSFRVAALPTDEISGPPLVYGEHLAAVSRDLNIGVSVDAIFGDSSSRAILEWSRKGWLGPHVELIHCTNLQPDAWSAIASDGATVCLAPTSDAQIGTETAIPAIDEALAVGIRPSLSVDVEVALASDMFTQMRALLAIQRMRAISETFGTSQTPTRIKTFDVLDFATRQGAKTIGLEDTTGKIAVGLAADLILVSADDINTMPMNDPIATVVLGADPRNIRAVFVAGKPKKWNGQVLGLDTARLLDDVVKSRDSIRQRVATSKGDA